LSQCSAMTSYLWRVARIVRPPRRSRTRRDDETMNIVRRIWSGGERGYPPISWLGYATVFMVGGVVFLVDRQWILGALALVLFLLSIYKTIKRFHETEP
jgi:hypothetical protein